MKKRSTQAKPSAETEVIKPEVQSRPATSHKSYQFIKFQDHSHGRQFKSPFGINHEPGIY